MQEEPDLFESEIRWTFEPLHPVREDVTGEVVFIKKWQKLMGGARQIHDEWFILNESERFLFLDVYNYHLRIPSERDSRVASSLIRWLGTNMGSDFLYKADELAKRMNVKNEEERSDAYLAQWVKENIRKASINHGGTQREFITMHLKDMYNEAATVRDYEMLERTVLWLGSDQGQDFIKKCQANIRLKQDRKWEERKARSIRPDAFKL